MSGRRCPIDTELLAHTNVSVVDVGAMMEPLAVAWHGVKRSTFKEGDKCLVLGSGPVRTATSIVHIWL